MKRISAILLLTIAIKATGFSQEILAKEDCLKNKNAPAVYIPGYKDCIFNRHYISRFRINPETLKNGFELKQTDTSFKIISFLLTFDFGDTDTVIEMPSTGNKILPRNDTIVSLSKIVGASLITIEKIRVFYRNRNVTFPSLTYYCIKE